MAPKRQYMVHEGRNGELIGGSTPYERGVATQLRETFNPKRNDVYGRDITKVESAIIHDPDPSSITRTPVGRDMVDLLESVRHAPWLYNLTPVMGGIRTDIHGRTIAPHWLPSDLFDRGNPSPLLRRWAQVREHFGERPIEGLQRAIGAVQRPETFVSSPTRGRRLYPTDGALAPISPGGTQHSPVDSGRTSPLLLNSA